MSTHHQLSPSNWPAWYNCGEFENDQQERSESNAGTEKHRQLEGVLTGQIPSEIDDDVAWAAQEILNYSDGDPIMAELPIKIYRDFKELTSGTADAVVPGVIICDFKSGGFISEDQMAQLAGYCLGEMQRLGIYELQYAILYGADRYVQRGSFTYDKAEQIAELCTSKSLPAKVNQWCKYCAKRMTCETRLSGAKTALESTGIDWPSLANDPEHLASVLQRIDVAESVFKDIRKKTKQAMQHEGLEVPGYQLITSNRRSVDVSKAEKIAPEVVASVMKKSVPVGDLEKAWRKTESDQPFNEVFASAIKTSETVNLKRRKK